MKKTTGNQELEIRAKELEEEIQLEKERLINDVAMVIDDLKHFKHQLTKKDFIPNKCGVIQNTFIDDQCAELHKMAEELLKLKKLAEK